MSTVLVRPLLSTLLGKEIRNECVVVVLLLFCTDVVLIFLTQCFFCCAMVVALLFLLFIDGVVLLFLSQCFCGCAVVVVVL